MPRDWYRGAPSSSTSTTEGFIGSPEIADAEIITRHFRASAVNSAALSTDSVTTNKIVDATVTSCKLSSNALYRTVIIPFSKLTSTETAGAMSSDWIIHRPISVMNITGIQIATRAAWQNATCDHFTLFRNSSSCVGNVGFKSIASTAPAAGTVSCVGSINNALISANTVLTMQSNVSTCSVSADANLIIHYISTE